MIALYYFLPLIGQNSNPDYCMDMGLATDLHIRTDSWDTFEVARMRMGNKSRDMTTSLLSMMQLDFQLRPHWFLGRLVTSLSPQMMSVVEC
jgi:hypothetical protein